MSSRIPYETTNKPWFGPRSRAKELLQCRTKVLPVEEALEIIETVLGSAATRIQRVRFIDYTHRSESDFRYTIALTWTFSDAVARQMLYEKAEDVVRATGWYPLPQGERIASRLALRNFRRIIEWRSRPVVRLEGSLSSFENAVDPDGGCAIRVNLDGGSLLLDTGLPGSLRARETDRVVLLSHFHLDHCGGIQANTIGNLPIVMSRPTAQMLLGLRRLPEEELRKRAVLLDYERPLRLGAKTIVRAFRVPHCPGSTGFELTDGENILLFTGDLALRTARHDFLPTLTARVAEAPVEKRCVLLDATMAGRSHGATSTNATEELFSNIDRYADIILVSQDVEQLLYAYLDLFFYAKDNPILRTNTAFLLSSRLKNVFRILHAAYIEHRLDQLDPFLASQYGASMSAWAESRWLYWLDNKGFVRPPEANLRVWFVSPDELARQEPAGPTALVSIGRSGGNAGSYPLDMDTLAVDSAAWTLHSDEQSLGEAVVELAKMSEVVLFHNFSKRISKFAKNFGLQCQPLSSKTMPIR